MKEEKTNQKPQDLPFETEYLDNYLMDVFDESNSWQFHNLFNFFILPWAPDHYM